MVESSRRRARGLDHGLWPRSKHARTEAYPETSPSTTPSRWTYDSNGGISVANRLATYISTDRRIYDAVECHRASTRVGATGARVGQATHDHILEPSRIQRSHLRLPRGRFGFFDGGKSSPFGESSSADAHRPRRTKADPPRLSRTPVAKPEFADSRPTAERAAVSATNLPANEWSHDTLRPSISSAFSRGAQMQRRSTSRSLHGAALHGVGSCGVGPRKCNAGAQAGLCTELCRESSGLARCHADLNTYTPGKRWRRSSPAPSYQANSSRTTLAFGRSVRIASPGLGIVPDDRRRR
jgi:hypothetical protein